MRVELKSGNKFYCDVCGEEIEGCGAGFEIKFDYGGEDECYGCFNSEGELFKELAKDDGELYEAVYNYLQQDTLIQCYMCRHERTDHYISDFEKAFRKRRVEIIRMLALEKKLPEFFEDEEEKKERIAQFETRKKKLLLEIKEIDNARELLIKGGKYENN